MLEIPLANVRGRVAEPGVIKESSPRCPTSPWRSSEIAAVGRGGGQYVVMGDDSVMHVLVVGGGFAGVACTHRLAGDPRLRVTLVDRLGYHQFQPLLYQVATAELTRQDIAFDLARMFRRHDNVEVRAAEVVEFDPQTRTVTLVDGRTLTGDAVVLAAGYQPNFFHTPGAREFAVPIYSLDDADRVRSRLIQVFQDAAAKPELVNEGDLNVVVVGGGPTGVETAGAVAELVHEVVPQVYESLALACPLVYLVNVKHTLLHGFSDQAHEYAVRQLTKRGVQLRLGTSIRQVAADHVLLSDGTTVPTRLTVWAGGLKAAQLAGRTGLEQGHGERITVCPDLTVTGHPDVYAVGDMANLLGPDGELLPQLGSVAAQSGDWAARNVLAGIEGAPRHPFRYRDKGIMAMIGRQAAVAELGRNRYELDGRLAFAAWLGVHAELLANAGAEVRAFLTWADEFYLRPHHRHAELLEASTMDMPRIDWESTRG